ncbi:3640_t:CDS:10 [Entrophospora sp. SA101]|nr:3640_t:CDS:10 [Entrophospora sp. SA101]
MSFDIFWEKLDSEVANKVQTILNNHFRNNTINNKPSFIGDIEISDLDFGTIPPLIEVIDITDPFPEFYLSDSATTVEVESGTDSVESQSLNTTDTQIHVAISYKGDMKMTITTELFMNYPSMRFMSLPIRLNVTGFEFSATAVVAFFKNRVNFCFLESKNPEESPLKDVHIESEIGDKEKQVLKNVGKLEKFIVNQLRKLIEEDFPPTKIKNEPVGVIEVGVIVNNVDKLSREFPADVISNKCQHVPSFCLKCITNYLNGRNSRQCPECKTSLNQKEIENVRFSWDQASFKIDINSINVIDDNKKLPSTSFVNRTNLVGNFYVVMLDGHKIQLRLEKIKTILALKQAINSEIKIEVTKQKLIYNEVELEDYHKNHFEKKLSDYQIVEGSHIQLIVLLYSISKNQSLNNLTFDLFWGFPGGLCDFLDGTCMLYNDRTFNRKFDYASRIHIDLKDISHSGDVMDAQNKRDKPNEQLCRYNIRMAASSQAVIMCVVSKNKIDGIWNIYEIGRLSSAH